MGVKLHCTKGQTLLFLVFCCCRDRPSTRQRLSLAKRNGKLTQTIAICARYPHSESRCMRRSDAHCRTSLRRPTISRGAADIFVRGLTGGRLFFQAQPSFGGRTGVLVKPVVAASPAAGRRKQQNATSRRVWQGTLLLPSTERFVTVKTSSS